MKASSLRYRGSGREDVLLLLGFCAAPVLRRRLLVRARVLRESALGLGVADDPHPVPGHGRDGPEALAPPAEAVLVVVVVALPIEVGRVALPVERKVVLGAAREFVVGREEAGGGGAWGAAQRVSAAVLGRNLKVQLRLLFLEGVAVLDGDAEAPRGLGVRRLADRGQGRQAAGVGGLFALLRGVEGLALLPAGVAPRTRLAAGLLAQVLRASARLFVLAASWLFAPGSSALGRPLREGTALAASPSGGWKTPYLGLLRRTSALEEAQDGFRPAPDDLRGGEREGVVAHLQRRQLRQRAWRDRNVELSLRRESEVNNA